MGFKFNIWRFLGLLALLFFCWYFFHIVIYLTISLVIFLIGYPLTNRLQRLPFGKRGVPRALAALLTLLVIASLSLIFLLIVIPPVVAEFRFLYGLKFSDVVHNILTQFPALESKLSRIGRPDDLKDGLSAQLHAYLNPDNLGLALNNTLTYFGSIAGGTFCVLFISFFFLKDEQLIKHSVLTLTPAGFEPEMRQVLNKSKKMLSRYFAGLLADMMIVGIGALVVLSIAGVPNAMIISFCAAVLNVIPYIGPFVTMLLALFLGVSGCISTGLYEEIAPVISKTIFSLAGIYALDGFLIQPLIFSNTIKAHPLEIFIVTLMAGTLAGIPGMIVALPVYTILRIIAGEFLSHLKFFRKISANLDS